MLQSVPFNLGDSLGAIAHQQLGDVSRFRDLADLNNLDIFQQIPINTELRIPNAADLERLAKERLGEAVGQIDLSAITLGRTGVTDINQVIKLIDFLY